MYEGASVAAKSRHFEDLSDLRVSDLRDVNCIRIACNRCGSAFVAANSRHFEDMFNLRVSDLRTIICVCICRRWRRSVTPAVPAKPST
jgi:hypothetical protein